MFSPSSSTSPLIVWAPPLGSRRMTDKAVRLLPQPEFADEPEHLAAPQREAHAVDRLDHAAAQEEVGVQVADFEDASPS